MKKMVKKGFSLMELLIVMVILAGLATMIIPNMSSGTEAAKLTSMRNDARNTISLLQAKYIDTQDYEDVFKEGDYTDSSSSNDGMSDTTLKDDSRIPISKGNSVELEYTSGTNCPSGFIAIVTNDTLTDKRIDYNSCTDGKIRVNTWGGSGWLN